MRIKEINKNNNKIINNFIILFLLFNKKKIKIISYIIHTRRDAL